MSARLLISVRPGETRAALIENGRLTWFDFIRTLHEIAPPPPVGAVFLGRVRKVEPGLQAAFVDLGLDGSAMLRAKDVPPPDHTQGAVPPIETLVHEGEAVIVQVSRLARDGKGPRVTADPVLPGPHGASLRPRRGATAPLWERIQEQARAATAPALLWRPTEPDPAVRLWRQAPDGPDVIEADHEPAAAALRRALAEAGSSADVLTCREDVFAAHDIDDEVDGLSNPVAALKGGGSLIIEPTAALTAIDVNARGALGSTTEDTALKVNLTAAQEIPRQIALRRLGGIIVIDFLRMKAARHRREIMARFKNSLEKYRIGATPSGFGAAGLIELVVPRTGTPLQERLRSPCPHCNGEGTVPDMTGRALALLARIVREARSGGPPGIEVRAATNIIDWLAARSEVVTSELECFSVTAVSWRAEADWPPDRMEVRRIYST